MSGQLMAYTACACVHSRAQACAYWACAYWACAHAVSLPRPRVRKRGATGACTEAEVPGAAHTSSWVTQEDSVQEECHLEDMGRHPFAQLPATVFLSALGLCVYREATPGSRCADTASASFPPWRRPVLYPPLRIRNPEEGLPSWNTPLRLPTVPEAKAASMSLRRAAREAREGPRRPL